MAASHGQRVHEVMDHVRENLSDDLSLNELAEVACFSPHHFHRVFKRETGETVFEFTRRARLERAVQLMRGSPGRELGSISAEVGFATPSDFSRLFRAHYGCTPSSWDRRSDLRPVVDAGPAAPTVSGGGACADDDHPLEAVIVSRPSLRLAYVRVADPWQADHLAEGYARLTEHLARRGVSPGTGHLVGMSWESARATPPDRLTYDLGVTVDDDFSPDDTVGVHELAAIRAVEVRCRGLRRTVAAWEYLYRTWLPESAHEPADGPVLKRFRRRPSVLDHSAWDVDCSIGLRPRWP